MSIDTNLRALRAARGMTQQEVADRLCVTRQALSGYESGRTRPDIDTLMRLCEIYDTDIESLLSGEDRAAKAARRVRIAAAVTLILLPALTLISSACLWAANRFFNILPLAAAGGLSKSDPVFVAHWRLLDAWEITDSILLAVSFFAFLLLLILLLPAGSRIRPKTKLLWCAALTAGLFLPGALLSLTDPLRTPVDYLTVPFLVTVRLLVFLAAHVLIAFIQKRRRRPA